MIEGPPLHVALRTEFGGDRRLPQRRLAPPGRPERVRDGAKGDRRLLGEGTSEQDLAASLPMGAAELLAQPRLADPRLAADQHDATRARRCAVQDELQQPKIRLPANQWKLLLEHPTSPGPTLPAPH